MSDAKILPVHLPNRRRALSIPWSAIATASFRRSILINDIGKALTLTNANESRNVCSFKHAFFCVIVMPPCPRPMASI